MAQLIRYQYRAYRDWENNAFLRLVPSWWLILEPMSGLADFGVE